MVVIKGLYEIAVLDSDGDLCYSTPITDDVIGYANEDKDKRTHYIG